jgi:hypothetical protein
MVPGPSAHHGLVEIGVRLVQPVGGTIHGSSVAGQARRRTDQQLRWEARFELSPSPVGIGGNSHQLPHLLIGRLVEGRIHHRRSDAGQLSRPLQSRQRVVGPDCEFSGELSGSERRDHEPGQFVSNHYPLIDFPNPRKILFGKLAIQIQKVILEVFEGFPLGPVIRVVIQETKKFPV